MKSLKSFESERDAANKRRELKQIDRQLRIAKEDADKIAMNWPDEIGGVAAWRAQEPINCQAHLQVCNVTRN